MKIQHFQPDEEGMIYIKNCIRLLTMGLKENVPTIWAAIDPDKKSGMPMTFVIKKDGDSMTLGDCQRYVTSFISNKGDGVWHLIGEEQKIIPATMPNPKTNPDIPGGKILL